MSVHPSPVASRFYDKTHQMEMLDMVRPPAFIFSSLHFASLVHAPLTPTIPPLQTTGEEDGRGAGRPPLPDLLRHRPLPLV